MNKYEKLKKIIQQANPEIMELKFGCRWKDESAEWVYVEGFSVTTSQKGGWTSIPPDTEQILGRPITFEDVLLAIKAYKIKLDFDTRSQPFLFITDWNDKTVIWDLTKSFDDQSQEIKDFLVGLLVKE